jgi:hypothetical protein
MPRVKRYKPIMCREDASVGAIREVAQEFLLWSRIITAVAEDCEKGKRGPSRDEVWLVNRSTAELNGVRWSLMSKGGAEHIPEDPSRLVEERRSRAAVELRKE